MLTLHPTTQFRKDYKLAKKRNLELGELQIVIDVLLAGKKLDEKYRGHPLHGEWDGVVPQNIGRAIFESSFIQVWDWLLRCN